MFSAATTLSVVACGGATIGSAPLSILDRDSFPMDGISEISREAGTLGAVGPALTQEQQTFVEALAGSLRPDQALWLGGYFTALGRIGREVDRRYVVGSISPPAGRTAAAADVSARSLTILFGSETGNCAALARSAAQQPRPDRRRPGKRRPGCGRFRHGQGPAHGAR